MRKNPSSSAPLYATANTLLDTCTKAVSSVCVAENSNDVTTESDILPSALPPPLVFIQASNVNSETLPRVAFVGITASSSSPSKVGPQPCRPAELCKVPFMICASRPFDVESK